MASWYKLSLIFLIAVTGVHSAMEETSPIEQYTDSGDTILKPAALAALKSAVLKGSKSGQNQQQQQLASLPIRIIEEYDDSDDSDILAEIKRAQTWNQFHGGWGKRANPIESNDAPGSSNWNRMNNLWGKRGPNWNNLNSVWGKYNLNDDEHDERILIQTE